MDNSSTAKKIINNQVARFIFSAGVGFLVDIGLFTLLDYNLDPEKSFRVLFLNIHNYQVFFSVSFFTGVLVNFLITRYLVFSESTTSFAKQFSRFVAVAVLGYFANIALLTFFTETLHFFLPVARVTAALSLFFASFFIHKFFSFSLALRHQTPGKIKRP